MDKAMAVEIIQAFENGADTIALNHDNTSWKSGSNWGADWADVDFDDFCEILDGEGLGYLHG